MDFASILSVTLLVLCFSSIFVVSIRALIRSIRARGFNERDHRLGLIDFARSRGLNYIGLRFDSRKGDLVMHGPAEFAGRVDACIKDVGLRGEAERPIAGMIDGRFCLAFEICRLYEEKDGPDGRLWVVGIEAPCEVPRVSLTPEGPLSRLVKVLAGMTLTSNSMSSIAGSWSKPRTNAGRSICSIPSRSRRSCGGPSGHGASEGDTWRWPMRGA